MKNPSTRTLKFFCAKNRSKKHKIFKKSDKFENRPSRKGYSPCKCFSLCKMVSLAQKLKIPKTCEKPFYKNIKVVLCKKTAPKNNKYSRNETSFENRPSCKGYKPCRGCSLCKMIILGQKFKMLQTCEKPFYKNFKVVLCKKPLKKTLNIREIRQV